MPAKLKGYFLKTANEPPGLAIPGGLLFHAGVPNIRPSAVLHAVNRRIQRGNGMNGLLTNQKLPANLLRRAGIQPPCVGIALKQRIKIGIQLHRRHLLTLACAPKAALMLDAG